MKYYLFFLFSLLIITCCETASDIDIGIAANKLDLRGEMHADSVIEVTLLSTRITTNSLSDFFQLKGSPEVRLFVDNQFVEQLIIRQPDYEGQFETFYRSPSELKPELGKNYSIEITSPNYETVLAETMVPEQFQITDVELVQQKTPITEGYFGLPVTVWFEDDLNRENFYQLEAFILSEIVQTYETSPGEFETTRTADYWQLPVTPRSYQGKGLGDDNPFELDIYFSDALLDNEAIKKYEFFVRVDKHAEGLYLGKDDQGDPNYYYTDSFFVRLKHITKAHYEYGRTSLAQLNKAEDPFAEPVFIRSNVEGGFGIFAAYTASDSEEITE